MCKVYEFPEQTVLPEEIMDMLEQRAAEYVKSMNEVVQMIDNICETLDEYNEMTEKSIMYYSELLQKAVEEL